MEKMNSQEYWDNRFKAGDWEKCKGKEQSIFFAEIAVRAFPDWFVAELNENEWDFRDYGCALGDGTAYVAQRFPSCTVTGVDISEEAVRIAAEKYPYCVFVAEDMTDHVEEADIIFTSNTLEHMKAPKKLLKELVQKARKYAVVLVPLEDDMNIEEHFHIFGSSFFPMTIGEHTLCCMRVIDCRNTEQGKCYWNGKQMLVIYVNTAYKIPNNSVLSDFYAANVQNLLEERISLHQELDQKDAIIEEKKKALQASEAIAQEKERRLHESKALAQEQERRLRESEALTQEQERRLRESEALVQEQERQLSDSAIRIEGCEKECNEAKAALEEQKKQMLSLQAGLGQLKADVAALEYWLDVAGRSKPLKLAHFVTQCKHALIGMPEEKKESRRWLCGDRSFVPKYSYLHQSAVSAARIRMSLEHISMHSDVQELRQNSMTAPGLDAKAFGAILDQYDKRTVIVFPELVDWNIPLFQRPQQMAMAFAKLGIMFIFVTPNGNDNVHQMKQLMDNCILMPPEHFEAAMDMLLDRKLDIILDICSTDNRHFMPWVERYTRKGCKVLYEYIDEISDDITGRVPKETYERHSAFLKDKNVWVVATADKLYNEVIQLRGGDENCLNSGNGVDLDHFRVEKNIKKVPKPIQSIVKKDKPVIGYFGAIANWFDFEMIEYAAKQRKEYEFLMIGPNYGTHNLDCLATLKEIPNLHFVGAVDYKTLPYVASYFTVATIPFLLNDITESTSPIKLFEYMAMGKPVVTTAMRECFKYPVVRIAKDKEDFVAALDESVAKAEDERFLMEIAGEAERNSWIKKAEELAELTGMNKAEV